MSRDLLMQNTHELEDGFYWVNVSGEWEIGRVSGDSVTFTEDIYWYPISDFDGIDPRPIVRPE